MCALNQGSVLYPQTPLHVHKSTPKDATRAGQQHCRYGYVHELMARFEGVAALHVLPSYAFAAALADYHTHKNARERAGEVTVTATGVHGAHDNLELDAKLANAVLTFPSALTELVAAMREKVRRRRLLLRPAACSGACGGRQGRCACRAPRTAPRGRRS